MNLTRLQKYAIGQHKLACADLGIYNNPDAPGPTLHEAVTNLQRENAKLREAIKDIAGQKLPSEIVDYADWKAGYESCVERARLALT